MIIVIVVINFCINIINIMVIFFNIVILYFDLIFFSVFFFVLYLVDFGGMFVCFVEFRCLVFLWNWSIKRDFEEWINFKVSYIVMELLLWEFFVIFMVFIGKNY